MKEDEELCNLKHKNIDDKIDELEKGQTEHEKRIQELEKNKIETKMELMQIQKSQIEVKNLILENDRKFVESNNKTNDKMDKVLDTVLSVFTQNNTSSNDIKFYNTKQFWVVVTAIATAIITFLTTRGGI